MRRQRDDHLPTLAARSPPRRVKRARQHHSVQKKDNSVTRSVSNQSRQDHPLTQGGQRAPLRALPLTYENHKHPPRPDIAPSQGRQHQELHSTLSPGGQTSPIEDQHHNLQLLGRVSPSQGSHRAPPEKRGDLFDCSTKTFPNCAHEISGDLLRDFLSSGGTECPRCQVESVEGTLHFEPCGHRISGDDLRAFYASGLMQPPILCPVCNRTSPRAMDAEATTRPAGEATRYSQRSRITIPDYEDPRSMEGVSSDIIVSQSGRPRFHVDPSVWRWMSKHDKKEFHWRCNIYFGLRSGGEIQPPTSQDGYSQVNVTLTNPSSAGPVSPNPSEAEANVPKGLPEEVHDKLANGSSVTRNKKQTPIQSSTPAYNRMTASAPRQTSRVGTEPATIHNPANKSIANPTDHSSAGEIASGSAVWDNRLLPEWLSSPDWKPASPGACIFMFCGVKSTTADDLNTHILRDHYGAPPTGTIVDARGDFLNAAALESYFGGNIPPSAQVYIGRWFSADCPQSHRDEGSPRNE